MSYLVLARKWRPKTFSEMVGQEHVLRALANALDSGKVHHAFLFTGTRGVGKTTVARILAKSLNCERGVSSKPCGECAACREIDEGRCVDLIEVDAASRTKVDDTRELLDNVQYAPTRARYKVYLIDEVHMLSNHSFNALLKTLEEPPPHVKFLLATTDPQKLPMTVLSRCLQFSLKRLSTTLIVERLRHIAQAEALRFETPALELVARAADGSMRDALSLLDQLIAFGGSELSEASARAMLGTIDRGRIGRILEALAAGDGQRLLTEAAELDQDAPDYDRVLADLAACLQRLAVLKAVPGAAPADEDLDAQQLARLAAAIDAEDVQLYYQISLAGRRDLAFAPDPRLGFEMTLLRMLAFRPEGTQEPVEPTRGARTAAAPQPAQTVRAPVAVERPIAASKPPVDAANWPAVVEAAQLSGMARQFALNCVPAGFENDVLRLALDPDVAARRTQQIEERVSEALVKYLGPGARVLFEEAQGQVLTPARQRAQDEQDRINRAASAFEQDPAVRSLRDRFGAAIDPASVKPIN